jgi:hypothetical protein
MLDLAFLDEILHDSRHFLDWHGWVNPMLIVQVDGFDVKAFKRAFDGSPNLIRMAVDNLLAIRDLDAELGRDNYFTFKWGNRFAYEFFVCIRTYTSAVSKNVTPLSIA